METNISQLIETCDNLCNTLSEMADNERKFGWALCRRMEQLSYDMYKSSQDMRDLKYYIGGQSI